MTLTTASLDPVRPARPPGLHLAVGQIVLSVVVAGACALAAWQLGRGQAAPAALVAGVALVLGALRWPRGAAIAVLAAIYALPLRVGAFGVAGLRSDIVELAAFSLFVLAAAHPDAGARLRPFLGPLLALGGALAFGAAVAALSGAERSSIVGPGKALALYLVAGPLLVLLGGDDGPALLERWLHRLSVIGSVQTLVTAVTGFGLSATASDEVITLGQATTADRLRPAILSLVFVATLLVVHELAVRGATVGRVARLVLYVGVQLVSFNRSSWVPLLLGVVVLLVLRPGERRPLRGFATALVVAAGALGGLALADAGQLGPTASAIAVRARSVTDPDVLQERSYQLRQAETDLAQQAIRAAPVTGVGLGQPYGNNRRVDAGFQGVRTVEPSLLLHNSPLKLWLWLGLPGIAAFIAIGWRAVRLAGLARRRLDAITSSRVLAATIALLALALRSSFQTSLTSRAATFAVVCCIVLIGVGSASPGDADRAQVHTPTTRAPTRRAPARRTPPRSAGR